MTLRKSLQSTNSSSSKGLTANEQTEKLLKEIKEKSAKVIRIKITERTTIELPASMTQVEIDARVANYKRLHQSKV